MNEQKEMAEIITKLSTKHREWDTFKDLIFVIAYAYSNIFPHAKYEHFEQEYLKIINSYDKEQQPYFSQFLALLIITAENNFSNFKDLFGGIYQELGFNNKNTGQFFTPQHISDMMAKTAIIKPDIEKEVNICGFIEVYEPTCGAGVSFLSAAKAIKELGYNTQLNMLCIGQDIDFLCACMAYVQCCIYCLPAIIKYGDTLAQNVDETFYSPNYCLNMNYFTKRGKYNGEYKQGTGNKGYIIKSPSLF